MTIFTSAIAARWLGWARNHVLHHAVALGIALTATAWVPLGEADPLSDTIPARLADTGLYADFAARTLAPGVLPFEPQYPLWTDGATKRRWIRLPPGASIDATNPDVWSFPRGTRLWKEFSFGHRIETRLMLRGGDGTWRFATYAWSADESDAVLAPERGVNAACESQPGKPFDIPARTDCNACHLAGPNVVLGFSALQLSSDRDPLAPHAQVPAAGAVDLSDLVRRNLVKNLPRALVGTPPRIAAASPIERAALGYLHGNCGMCHTDSGQLASLDLDLWTSFAGMSIEPQTPDTNARRTTNGHASRFVCDTSTHALRSASALRVSPGDPDASVLLRRMASRQPLSQMPPLGTHVADAEALELVTQWIRSQSGAVRVTDRTTQADAGARSAGDPWVPESRREYSRGGYVAPTDVTDTNSLDVCQTSSSSQAPLISKTPKD